MYNVVAMDDIIKIITILSQEIIIENLLQLYHCVYRMHEAETYFFSLEG